MYFNGLLLLSAQFVRIATNDMLVITNGTVFVSAHRVQIATWSSRPITDGTTTLSQRTACRSQLAPSSMNTTALLFVSAHRVQIATHPFYCGTCLIHFVSAHRVQIATDAQVILLHQHHLCLSAPRADRNGKCAQSTACGFVECAVSR